MALASGLRGQPPPCVTAEQQLSRSQRLRGSLKGSEPQASSGSHGQGHRAVCMWRGWEGLGQRLTSKPNCQESSCEHEDPSRVWIRGRPGWSAQGHSVGSQCGVHAWTWEDVSVACRPEQGAQNGACLPLSLAASLPQAPCPPSSSTFMPLSRAPVTIIMSDWSQAMGWVGLFCFQVTSSAPTTTQHMVGAGWT